MCQKAKLAHFIVGAFPFRIHEQADGNVGKIAHQTAHDRNRGIVLVAYCEKNFVFGIFLTAKAGEIFVSPAVQTAQRLENADGRSELAAAPSGAGA